MAKFEELGDANRIKTQTKHGMESLECRLKTFYAEKQTAPKDRI